MIAAGASGGMRLGELMANKREIALWAVVVILFVVTVLLATLHLWGVRPLSGVIDYARFGSWSQALAGIGTFCAVTVALASLLWQQSKARRDADKAVTAEQTSVYLWLTATLLEDPTTGKIHGRHWDVEVHNLTKAPIYQWRIGFPGHPSAIGHEDKRPLLPDQNIFNLPAFDHFAPKDIPEPFIVFRSRDGRYWKRTSEGLVSEARAEDLARELAN